MSTPVSTREYLASSAEMCARNAGAVTNIAFSTIGRGLYLRARARARACVRDCLRVCVFLCVCVCIYIGATPAHIWTRTGLTPHTSAIGLEELYHTLYVKASAEARGACVPCVCSVCL